jgi:hypothetical protein
MVEKSEYGGTKSRKNKNKPKLNRKSKTKKLNLLEYAHFGEGQWKRGKHYRGWGTTQLEICMKEMTNTHK